MVIRFQSSMSDSIGSARMEADGTIVLDLTARTGGAVGHARKVYAPSHAEYKKVLDHVGGLRPGEQKRVPPWPDPWDASRVESAAREHASRAKGWPAEAYRIEITGTDADGNAVVTLMHTGDAERRSPGGGKSVQLRIDAKTYAVVRELAMQ